MNHKRVERLWRREGLKVPSRQPKRKRLWLNDGSCVRLRPQRRNHVWTYDFVYDRPHDGRGFRMLTVLDEYTRECLAIKVARRLNSNDVLETLAEAKAIIESWRREYDQVRPHSSLGYRPPAPEAVLPALPSWDTEVEPAAS